MDTDMVVTVEQEIAQIRMTRPHVILLGAGASRAAFPNGDRNGRTLPLMNDFIDIVGLSDILVQDSLSAHSSNFEETYADIAKDPRREPLRLQLEAAIYSYFDSLALPSDPTPYDVLVLSLRPKDVIATFNWDPFLIQAARRNPPLNGQLPRIVFLHGNVLAGFCPKDALHGVKGARCSRCGEQFQPSRLLYPIADKNYHTDPMIANAWELIDWALKNAFMLTVFGYSAPKSDRSAMELLAGAWGGWQRRQLEHVEIIDVRGEHELVDEWNRFIHTHHYKVQTSFAQSWLARHPRRTGEAYLNQFIEAKFISDNPITYMSSFEALWEWLTPLFLVEGSHQDGKST